MAVVLVTRPEPDATDTVARLAALDIEGIAVPLLTRAPLETSLPPASGFAALALTSANALLALAERDALAPYVGLPIFAVGDRTAAAARMHGFTTVVSAGGTLTHLVDQLGSASLNGPVFYPAARHQSADLGQQLAPHGVAVVTARVYEMRPAAAMPLDVEARLAGGSFDAVLFYSRRTAGVFVDLVGERISPVVKQGLGVLCLSSQIAAPLLAAHFVRVGLAERPDETAMLSLALSFVRERNTS